MALWPSWLERWTLERWTGDRVVQCSNPATATYVCFGTLAIPTPFCRCLSDEILKAVGPFYLVSMPAEVKYPTSCSIVGYYARVRVLQWASINTSINRSFVSS